jgi:AcrR family transcriptional regulator
VENHNVVPHAASRTKRDGPKRDGRSRAAHLGPDRRRPLILDAALQIFVERGYRGTSMQAVAEAAGVTKPVVYECYPSKDELLLALLDREERRLLESVTAALPNAAAFQQPGTFDKLEVVLAAGFTAFLVGASQAPNSWRVVFESRRGSDSVVAVRVRRAREMVLGQLRELVRSYLQSVGSVDIERKVPVVAELLATVAESCARMLVLENYPWSAPELATYVSRVITRGVTPG